MTPIRIHAPLLRALHTLARTFCVAFLAIPGTGFALLAVACGDLDVPRESMTHDAVVADSIASPITAHPIRPVLDEPIESPSVPEPPQPSVTELSEEPTVVVSLPPLDEAELEDEPECEEAPSPLTIVDAATAHGVARRTPIRPGQAFHIGEVVWAWIAVKNAGDEAPVTMIWRRDGVVRSRMTLNVGKSPRWRTWSRKTLRSNDAGHWTVDVMGPMDEHLQTLTFEVAPSPVDVTSIPEDFTGC